MSAVKILVFSGSLRTGSLNTKLAGAAARRDDNIIAIAGLRALARPPSLIALLGRAVQPIIRARAIIAVCFSGIGWRGQCQRGP